MAENGINRRPTEDEQRIIGAVSRDLARLLEQHHQPVAVGMRPGVIRDPERGRWSRILGLAVVEVPDHLEVPGDVFLLLEVQHG